MEYKRSYIYKYLQLTKNGNLKDNVTKFVQKIYSYLLKHTIFIRLSVDNLDPIDLIN